MSWKRICGGRRAYVGADRVSRRHASRPRCASWFRRASDMSDLRSRGKCGRAAGGDWKDVLAAIEAMTEKRGYRPAGYWKARSLKALGRDGDPEALLKPLGRVQFLRAACARRPRRQDHGAHSRIQAEPEDLRR